MRKERNNGNVLKIDALKGVDKVKCNIDSSCDDAFSRMSEEDMPPILDDEDIRPSTEISPARNKRLQPRHSNPSQKADKVVHS